LLGADNKSGIAEIMDAAHFLMTHPEVKHGAIRILFTPDEEISRGTDYVDMKRLGAQYGYTMDGESLGHLENETFSADGVSIVMHGIPTHPGFGKMIKWSTLLKLQQKLLIEFRKIKPPETTENETTIHASSFHQWWIRKSGNQFYYSAHFDTATLNA